MHKLWGRNLIIAYQMPTRIHCFEQKRINRRYLIDLQGFLPRASKKHFEEVLFLLPQHTIIFFVDDTLNCVYFPFWRG